MFLSLGIVLPFFTGQIPEIGSMLLPMHIPVFLCAFVCGAKYSAPMAFALPLIRAILFGRPNLYPEAVAIAFELCAYAILTSLIYERMKNCRSMTAVYTALIASMIGGRIVRGSVQMLLLRFIGIEFPFKVFLNAVVFTALPGIAIQLILIPAVMAALIHKNKQGK